MGTKSCKAKCTDQQTFDAKTKKCVDRCDHYNETWNPKTKKCDHKTCPDGVPMVNGQCKPKKTHCSKGQILVEGKCYPDIRIEVPMNDYWRRNRETEDMELMMEEFKRTAVFFGNRVDTRVHHLIDR